MYRDKVIDGFLVPSMMQRAWDACLSDYLALAEVCKENGLNCFATWGTLIGAIRHSGFIPWDDDIDVCMRREDYAKLVSIVGREENPGGYHVEDYVNTGTDNMVKRWLKKGVLIYDPDEWESRHGFPFGDVIDIFMMDFYPDASDSRKKHDKTVSDFRCLREMAMDIYGDDTSRNPSLENDEFRELLSTIERQIGKKVTFSGQYPIHTETMLQLEEYLRRFDIRSSSAITDLLFWNHNEERLLPAEYLNESIEVDFEWGKMRVPIAYDDILRRYYGNPMGFSLVDWGHSYPFYDKYAKELKEKLDFELLHFEFDVDKYNGIMSDKEEKKPLSDLLKTGLDVLVEAHDFLRSCVRDDADHAEMNEVLSMCQETAIVIGNEIESRAVNDFGSISTLEKYCEYIYELHEKTLTGDRDNDLLNGLEEHETRIRDALTRKYQEKREVVFLCMSGDDWKALQSIWECAVEDKETSVSVIALPFKEKDAKGIPVEGEWITDTDGFPEEVELTSYDEYDLMYRHPDLLVYQLLYDEYSDGFIIHPNYYSSNLRKCCEKMVFIPPFKLREIEEGQSRPRYTLGKFLMNPGAVYSDQIVVQSEGIKDVCVDLLQGFVPEIDWDKRICSFGTPINDYEYQEQKKIDRIKDGKKELIICFTGSAVYTHKMELINKMESVLNRIQDLAPDLLLRVVRDPYAESILKERCPDEWEEYKRLVPEEAPRDEQLDELIRRSDGFYGDSCVLMNRCRERGVPTMLEVPEYGVCSDEMIDDKKLWEKDKMPVLEGDSDGRWNLSEFMKAVLDYKVYHGNGRIGKDIWEKIRI